MLQSVVMKVAHWRGHLHPVTSVDIMKGHELLVSASKDMKVCLWTLTGCLVGVLGEHEWDLSNKKTWQDPHGTQTKPPLQETEKLYLQVSGHTKWQLLYIQCSHHLWQASGTILNP